MPAHLEEIAKGMEAICAELKGGLVVSCQASEGEPLCRPEHICALAESAIAGGARGLRLEGAENISCVRKKTRLPIVGLTKSKAVSKDKLLDTVYITATFEDAKSIALAGADVIALDATNRPRPGGMELEFLIKQIHEKLGKPVWADASTLEEGIFAAKAGANIVSTTLSGYTRETFVPPESSGPDLKLLSELAAKLSVPVVLEGRVWHPEEVKKAFEHGAFAVVVGSAITRPHLITRRFVEACARHA